MDEHGSYRDEGAWLWVAGGLLLLVFLILLIGAVATG
jgi:hypothetical protein